MIADGEPGDRPGGPGQEERPIPGDQFDPEAPEEAEIAAGAATERSDFLGVMGDLYRAEVTRTTTWRDRLDKTSNWSVVIVATLLTWAFSTERSPHGVILVGMVMVSIFLFFESRRYRMYDVWRSRVRLLEENVFANALHPDGATHRGWRRYLAEDLRQPQLKISEVEALGRRLRRIYMALLLVLLISWLVQLHLLGGGLSGMVAAAEVSLLPGRFVVAVVAVFYAVAGILAYWPRKREAKGEMLDYEAERETWKLEE